MGRLRAASHLPSWALAIGALSVGVEANDGDAARVLCGQWMPGKTKGRYHAAEGWERCRLRVRAWCTIEMTSAVLIGTASAVAMFIPAMCLVVEMPSK